MTKLISPTWYLYKRGMKRVFRQPVWIFMSLSTPLLLIALYAPLLTGFGGETQSMGDVLKVFVPALLSLIAFSAGINTGWDVLFDLRDGVIERFRVTSSPRFSMLLGPILQDVTMFLVPVVILILVALPIGFTIHFGGLIIMLLLLAMLVAVFASFSCAVALLVKENGSFAAVTGGLQMPIMLLAGIMLPLSAGPKWLQVLGHFNPLYYTVEASRDLAVGNIMTSSVYIAFSVFIPLLMLTMWWATRVYKKAVK